MIEPPFASATLQVTCTVVGDNVNCCASFVVSWTSEGRISSCAAGGKTDPVDPVRLSIVKRLTHHNQPLDRDGRPRPRANRLTPRESEVLQLVAEGSANKQVATKLGISIKTIEKHRQQVMNKLNIHETAGLTRYAISRGLVEGGGRLGALQPSQKV